MYLLNKTLCLLLLAFLVVNIFPQEQSDFLITGNTNNSSPKRSIYNVSTITPFENINSTCILDSLIYITLNGDRSRIVFNYYNNLTLNYFINASLSNGEWKILEKNTNTYNSEGKLISVLGESFNSTTNEWHQTEKDTYNYDSLGNKIFRLHQSFNGQEFVNSTKFENYYDGSNLLLTVNQKWIDNIWVNSSKSIYTYTPENINDTIIVQLWTNDQWVNYYLTNYKYDGNLTIDTVYSKIWQEQQWIDYALAKLGYDENNNLVLENWQNNLNNHWENWFRIFYEYDADNNLVHLFGEEWVNGNWVPENEPLKVTHPDGILFVYEAAEIFLYYSEHTSAGNEKSNTDGFNLFQNYPNPFNPATNIEFRIAEPGFVSLKVYDILGREVAVLVNEEMKSGTYKIRFSTDGGTISSVNGNNLSSGIYFYTLKAGSFVQTKKMIVLR